MSEEITTTPVNEEDLVVEYTPTTLEQDLKNMDKTYFSTDKIRQSIIDKLMPIALDMDIDTDSVCDKEGAAALDAKMGVITTLSNLLNDQDKAIKTKIEIKTKQRELIENGKQTELFIAALNEFTQEKIKSMANKAQATADDDLSLRMNEDGMEINEAELRSDPNDLT